MSWKYANAKTFWCDTSGCGAKLWSPSGDVTDGRTTYHEIYDVGGTTVPVVECHRCPSCTAAHSAKESAA